MQRPQPRSLISLGLWASCLVWLGVGATCENQDYFLPQRLTLQGAAINEAVATQIALPYRGRNTLDFTVNNTGGGEALFGIAVSIGCSDTEACSERLFTRAVGPVVSQGSAAARMPDEEIGLGDQLLVQFQCLETETACDAELMMSVLLRQVECRDDTECATGFTCNLNRGVCEIVEEEEEAGCRTTARPQKSGPLAWLLYAIAGFLTLRRRSRPSC